MSTISDVARLARVSPSTVSNVLNGRVDKMSKETLGRVQQAVAELGFQPNRTARQLKTGQVEMLGLLVPSMANPSYGLLAREIEAVLRKQHGYRVIVANTYRDPKLERAFVEDMWSQGVRGVIVISSLSDEAHFEEPVSRGLVAVSYDSHARRDRQPILDYVSADNVAGASLAVRHLVANGHKRIAFLTPSGWTFSRAEKREGFVNATKEAGVQGVIIAGSTASHYADEEMAELGQSLAAPLIDHPDRPTAAVAINDMMAIGLMAGLRERGLTLPRDMSVIGMDGIPLGAYTAPPLTSICLPTPELASTMVERIMLRLKQPGTKPDEFRFTSTLLERGSVTFPR